jgi:hypothetical protein
MSPFRKLLFSFSLAVGILTSTLPLSAQTSDKAAGGLNFAPLTFGEPSAANAVDVDVSATLKKIDDQTAELQVTMTLPDGYYTYSMSPDFGGGTKIKLTGLGELKEEGDWKADHEPKSVLDEALGQTVEKFFSKVTWSKTLKGSLAGDVYRQWSTHRAVLRLRRKWNPGRMSPDSQSEIFGDADFSDTGNKACEDRSAASPEVTGAGTSKRGAVRIERQESSHTDSENRWWKSREDGLDRV